MAAGYDLSVAEGFEKFCSEFETLVGWQWLVGVHVNDSLGPAGSHRDRHANIGHGMIGEEGFRRIPQLFALCRPANDLGDSTTERECGGRLQGGVGATEGPGGGPSKHLIQDAV